MSNFIFYLQTLHSPSSPLNPQSTVSLKVNCMVLSNGISNPSIT